MGARRVERMQPGVRLPEGGIVGSTRISDQGHRSRPAHRPTGRPVQARASFGRHDPQIRSAVDALALQRLAGIRAFSRLLYTSSFVAGEDHPMERRAEVAERGDRSSSPPIDMSPTGPRRSSPLATESGAPVPAAAAADLGLSAGAVSGVRVHRGAEADELNEALGSEGFTHGSDVFLSRRFYQPGTASGNQLLAHELSHASGPAAASGGLYMKKQKKYLDFLRFKRKETHIARMLTSMALNKVGAKGLAQKVDTDKQGEDYDHYGHWWVEAGSLADDTTSWTPAESYGWWPAQGVGIAETLKISRVEGLLNQGDKNDPHHGEKADLEFHPVMEVDDSESYEAIRDRVMGEVHNSRHGLQGQLELAVGLGQELPHLPGPHEEGPGRSPPEGQVLAAGGRSPGGEAQASAGSFPVRDPVDPGRHGRHRRRLRDAQHEPRLLPRQVHHGRDRRADRERTAPVGRRYQRHPGWLEPGAGRRPQRLLQRGDRRGRDFLQRRDRPRHRHQAGGRGLR